MTDRTSKDETLDSWLKGCEEHIESGIATDLVAICPVALRRFIYELRERRAAETKAECPTGVRPHDLCSAGTCSTCTDAERYRFIRQSETRLDPFEEEVYGEVWKAILPKGCDEEKMDAAIDAGLKRLGLKTRAEPAKCLVADCPEPTADGQAMCVEHQKRVEP